MKKSKVITLVLLMPIISSCSDDQTTYYSSIESCYWELSKSTCDQAYQKSYAIHIRNVQFYNSMESCQENNPFVNCSEVKLNNNFIIYGPSMTGFYLSDSGNNYGPLTQSYSSNNVLIPNYITHGTLPNNAPYTIWNSTNTPTTPFIRSTSIPSNTVRGGLGGSAVVGRGGAT